MRMLYIEDLGKPNNKIESYEKILFFFLFFQQLKGHSYCHKFRYKGVAQIWYSIEYCCVRFVVMVFRFLLSRFVLVDDS